MRNAIFRHEGWTTFILGRMSVIVSRPYGRTHWGLFGNVWPTAECRADRETLNVAYLDIHTPFGVIEIMRRLRHAR